MCIHIYIYIYTHKLIRHKQRRHTHRNAPGRGVRSDERGAGKFPMDLGIPPHEIENLTGGGRDADSGATRGGAYGRFPT